MSASETCTWSGSWDNTPDEAGDHIVIRSGDLTWNSSLPSNVASWVQENGYTDTVTFETEYPGQGAFTNFTITGDCVISNGVWQHADDNSETFWLHVTVGGDFVLGSNAAINVDGLGYDASQGPGRYGHSNRRLCL